jgi:hypothetical protein
MNIASRSEDWQFHMNDRRELVYAAQVAAAAVQSVTRSHRDQIDGMLLPQASHFHAVNSREIAVTAAMF